MRVRMVTGAAGPQGVWPPGAVIEASESLALALIAGGYAEAVSPPEAVIDAQPAPVEPPVVEAAVDAGASARRTAVGPGQHSGRAARKRKG